VPAFIVLLPGAAMARVFWIITIVTGEWWVNASRAMLRGKAF